VRACPLLPNPEQKHAKRHPLVSSDMQLTPGRQRSSVIQDGRLSSISDAALTDLPIAKILGWLSLLPGGTTDGKA